MQRTWCWCFSPLSLNLNPLTQPTQAKKIMTRIKNLKAAIPPDTQSQSRQEADTETVRYNCTPSPSIRALHALFEIHFNKYDICSALLAGYGPQRHGWVG